MNFNIRLIAIVLITLIVGSFILKKKNLNLQDTNTFTIGTAAGYAPFVSINAQSEYEGFDIDIAKALAQKLGKKLVIKDLGSMAPLFIALEQGTIDAIIWGLSITQERLKKVIMIRYQGEATLAYPLIFWKQIPANIQKIEDMRGMTICVEPTSSQDAVLNKYSFIVKKTTEKVDDALLNIQYGKADAAFVEPAIAQKFKNKYAEIQILNVPLAPEDQVQGIGITIKKENGLLSEEVQKAVQQLECEGIIQILEKKWGIA